MNFIKNSVKLLTLTVSFSLCSCSFLYERYSESCNSRAYLQRGLTDYISSRFHYNSPVRLAVIPFSSPANLSAIDTERPGLGNEIAWKIHAGLLESGQIPIVEVFNRQDWPNKKEEFFTGNFDGIDMARAAGYDLLLVGQIEPQKSLDELASNVKLIDADSGVTVYYGRISSQTNRRSMQDIEDKFWISKKIPSMTYTEKLVNKLSQCVVEAVIQDPAT